MLSKVFPAPPAAQHQQPRTNNRLLQVVHIYFHSLSNLINFYDGIVGATCVLLLAATESAR